MALKNNNNNYGKSREGLLNLAYIYCMCHVKISG